LLSPTGDLKRLPIGVDLRAISLAEGLRAALSIAVLVVADEWLHWPPMLEAALAALLTCLCDTGGPILKRIPPLLSFALLGAAITGGFGLLRDLNFGVIPLASAAIFCLGYLRVYGPAAQQVGNLASVSLVLALDRPLSSWAEAGELAAVFAGGSVWALLLTMVLWRIRPFRPVRRSVAGCYRALAELVADLRRLAAAPAIEPAEWEAHARAYRRNVRNTIELARGVVLDVLRGRGGASQRATVYLIRLEIADQIFGAMLALSDLLEPTQDRLLKQQSDRFLRLLRPTLIVFGQVIERQTPERLVRLSRSVDALAALPLSSGGPAPQSQSSQSQSSQSQSSQSQSSQSQSSQSQSSQSQSSQSLAPIAEAVVDRLRAFISLETPPDQPASAGKEPKEAAPTALIWDWRTRLMGPIIANFDRDSAALRHAARAGVVSVAGFAITIAWPGPYQHWLTIVMVMTMQPYYALTLQRALERIGGTVLGGALAAGLAMVCRTPGSMVLALFPLAVGSLAFRPASFGVFITLLTPLVVLLSELGRPGTSQFEIAAMRALYTVIGGLLAVGGSVFLWPSWEPDRLANELRAAIAAHGHYAVAELSFLLGEATAEDVDSARRAAGIASNNLESSLSRALLEPRRRALPSGLGLLEGAITVDAALRRMAGRLSAMQLSDGHTTVADPPLEAVWRAWRTWIATAMTSLSAPRPVLLSKRPPTGTEKAHSDSLERVGRQIETIFAILERIEKIPQ
jgi:uncharacterized membrane protein YccC